MYGYLRGNRLATASEVDSLKTSVSNGKAMVAAAVTDKGVQTAADATFNTIANNIRNIKTGYDVVWGSFEATPLSDPGGYSITTITIPEVVRVRNNWVMFATEDDGSEYYSYKHLYAIIDGQKHSRYITSGSSRKDVYYNNFTYDSTTGIINAGKYAMGKLWYYVAW